MPVTSVRKHASLNLGSLTLMRLRVFDQGCIGLMLVDAVWFGIGKLMPSTGCHRLHAQAPAG